MTLSRQMVTQCFKVRGLAKSNFQANYCRGKSVKHGLVRRYFTERPHRTLLIIAINFASLHVNHTFKGLKHSPFNIIAWLIIPGIVYAYSKECWFSHT